MDVTGGARGEDRRLGRGRELMSGSAWRWCAGRRRSGSWSRSWSWPGRRRRRRRGGRAARRARGGRSRDRGVTAVGCGRGGCIDGDRPVAGERDVREVLIDREVDGRVAGDVQRDAGVAGGEVAGERNRAGGDGQHLGRRRAGQGVGAARFGCQAGELRERARPVPAGGAIGVAVEVVLGRVVVHAGREERGRVVGVGQRPATAGRGEGERRGMRVRVVNDQRRRQRRRARRRLVHQPQVFRRQALPHVLVECELHLGSIGVRTGGKPGHHRQRRPRGRRHVHDRRRRRAEPGRVGHPHADRISPRPHPRRRKRRRRPDLIPRSAAAPVSPKMPSPSRSQE